MKQSLTPRYTTSSLPIPIALSMLNAILAEQHADALTPMVPRRTVRLLLAVQLTLFRLGYAQAVAFNRHMLRDKACLTWSFVFPYQYCMKHLFLDPTVLMSRARAVDELGYLRPHLRTTATDERITRFVAEAVSAPYLEWKIELSLAAIQDQCGTKAELAAWAYEVGNDRLCPLGAVSKVRARKLGVAEGRDD